MLQYSTVQVPHCHASHVSIITPKQEEEACISIFSSRVEDNNKRDPNKDLFYSLLVDQLIKYCISQLCELPPPNLSRYLTVVILVPQDQQRQ